MCFAGIEGEHGDLERALLATVRTPGHGRPGSGVEISETHAMDGAAESEPSTFRLPKPEADKTAKIERPLQQPQAA